ncbi:proteoglycan 4-like [Eriocheir sinensis]|uniref:proteoglycan 4-like n=1 Tax=Eriocheir sinensis TaxID=95602 RepID=UPI0021C7FA78|nr:proteoglycan 4-like [Eriocheir sinensis]
MAAHTLAGVVRALEEALAAGSPSAYWYASATGSGSRRLPLGAPKRVASNLHRLRLGYRCASLLDIDDPVPFECPYCEEEVVQPLLHYLLDSLSAEPRKRTFDDSEFDPLAPPSKRPDEDLTDAIEVDPIDTETQRDEDWTAYPDPGTEKKDRWKERTAAAAPAPPARPTPGTRTPPTQPAQPPTPPAPAPAPIDHRPSHSTPAQPSPYIKLSPTPGFSSTFRLLQDIQAEHPTLRCSKRKQPSQQTPPSKEDFPALHGPSTPHPPHAPPPPQPTPHMQQRHRPEHHPPATQPQIPTPPLPEGTLTITESALKGLLKGLVVTIVQLLERDVPETTLDPIIDTLVTKSFQQPPTPADPNTSLTREMAPPTPRPEPATTNDPTTPAVAPTPTVTTPPQATTTDEPQVSTRPSPPHQKPSDSSNGTCKAPEEKSTSFRRQLEGKASTSSSSKKPSLQPQNLSNSEAPPLPARWNVKKADWTIFREALQTTAHHDTPDLDLHAAHVTAAFRAAADASMPAITARNATTDTPLSAHEVQNALRTGADTSPGSDGITHTMIRQAGLSGHAALLSLFSASLDVERLPHSWKEADIIPIPKPKDPGSFRPISLLSCIGKTMERIILSRL